LSRLPGEADVPEVLDDLMALRVEPAVARERLAVIREEVLGASPTLQGGMFDSLSRPDLRLLFERYDAHAFGGFLQRELGPRIAFDLSERMASAGGRTTWEPADDFFTITLASGPLRHTFTDEVDRPIHVCGCLCHDRLEAAQRIFEHELCHLVEFLVRRKSSCRGKPFQHLARGLFGHQDHRHRLVTRREYVAEAYGVQVGSPVRFAYQGRVLEGIVSRITKRATVMVRDPKGEYRDKRGRRYGKYYVEVDALQSA